MSDKNPKPDLKVVFPDLEDDGSASPAGGESPKPGEAGKSPEPSKWGDVSSEPDNGWSTISLDTEDEELPPDGIYPGFLEVELRDKGDVLWMQVGYRLKDHAARPHGDMGALAATPGSEHKQRIGDGKRLLRRVAAATGNSTQRNFSIDGLKGMFDGKPVRLRVRKRVRDGIPELVVAEILPA